ncbi:MAG TPA: TonB-dependent receptor [Rhizomicrobium sp.]|jgi:outer membrane receptor protein involved in Fe transport
MQKSIIKAALLASACMFASAGHAETFNIPGGDLKTALDSYAAQTGQELLYAGTAVQGVRSAGARGEFTADSALVRLLSGTGFTIHRDASGAIAIVHGQSASMPDNAPTQLAQSAPAAHAVETVTVTSSKLGGADVQSIPIAITALSQEQLTASQTAGGPDLIKQVPNMTFTKTNFSGYSINIRGIGTQAISVTTDPAVAVAFNDMPFIRNHFFEQEFFDVSQVEVLRGPQGTLYGRNATAGVVNLTSAKPTDQFEAMASADIGNYKNRRFEGMMNLPIVDDRLDLRLAGEWTKRDGYSFNSLTDSPIDGRDLWSGRATIGFKPSEKFNTYFVWEHFQENDDRLRSSKQLCKRDNGPATVGGFSTANGSDGKIGQEYLSQGCLPASPYSDEAFQVPNALSLPYYGGLIGAGFGQSLGSPLTAIGAPRDPYANTRQSTDLRVIESTLDPVYRAKGDTFMLNADYALTPSLNLVSQTGYSTDFLWATEDYNRFNTQPGIFGIDGILTHPDGNYACSDGTTSIGGNNCASPSQSVATGSFCDPQLGCSNRLVAEDLVSEHSWQLNQEFRLASHFAGPFNFSVGGNYMHYETYENYYVFFNTLTMFTAKTLTNWTPGNPATQKQCAQNLLHPDPQNPGGPNESCLGWIDSNPITSLDNKGHNYFLSQNPYTLNSYAGFGEAYYNVAPDLKLTGGLRWTADQKHFVDIPSELLTQGYGYTVTGVVNQQWREWTGRFAANWTPKLDFTDQTLVYGSFAHGYKAGGANPPGAVLIQYAGSASDLASAIHPLTFDPEFINAYELGSKNTLLDGAVTFNASAFYYDYKGYQISQIIDRTSINLNFDATVKGAELETTWEPLPGLKFNFSGGYENTRLADGSKAVDLIDRAAGNPNWIVVKPFVTQTSNCILPTYVIAYHLNPSMGSNANGIVSDCGWAYNSHFDPLTGKPYTTDLTGATTTHGDPIPLGAYPGFDPLAGTPGHPYTGQNTFEGVDYGPAPNNGAGFDKDLSGNELPNAPHFTTAFSAEYSMPLTSDWAATLHGDFYWQASSWARIFNDNPYDRLHGYKTVNFALILTNQNGWQAVGYLKNAFNTTAITGTFLNSDDSGLTTNVFLTDPRLFGVRITKNW